jgi:predicted Ser/Thr protein kinase/tetratricopeptide (TPR) repeat protein
MNQNANTLGIFTEHVPRMGCPHCGAELDVSEFGVFEDITCPSCQKTIKVPGLLGNFVLLEELGRGAMGCVYLAQDESLGRLVALKVMRREYGDDPKMLETLQREAQAMATLNHPNVVQVYSFGREAGQPYFVMELLQGERLDAMMADGGIVNELRLLEISIDVAKGLEAAGNAGMTHGDIKPANILMNDAGIAKVVDFGLARFMDPDAEVEVWGTPYYIAPEKARKKGEDSRSDQYSLGATLFHALAGRPPFDGENPTKVVIAALKEETPDIRAQNATVTPETAAVIRRMMDKTPARRYPTYASLLADLQVALDAARKVAEEKRLAELMEEQKKKAKRNPLPMIMGAVVLMLLLVAGVMWFLKQKKQEVIQIDKWPMRKLEAPFERAEERNMEEGMRALAKGDFGVAEEKLATAARLIPDEHAAKAWYRFLAAGAMIYAQYPERARSLLQEAIDQDPIIFSGGRVPAEDPRILARHALDQLSEKDLERALARTPAYYVHLAELARGYRHQLAGRNNDAARHFRAYGEIPGQGWPYVLKPLASSMHLSREQMVVKPTPNPIAPVAKPTPTPKGPDLKPTATPRPAATPTAQNPSSISSFKISDLDKNNAPTEASWARDPGWSKIETGNVAWINSNQVVSQAGGLQILPGRRFQISGILRSPSDANRPADQPVVLFHLGGRHGGGAAAIPHGMTLEMPPPGDATPPLRLRIGDGNTVTFEPTLPAGIFKPGTVQLFSLSWDATPQASNPNRLVLCIDGKTVGDWSLRPEQLPSDQGLEFGSWGRGLNDNGRFEHGAVGVEVIRAMVLDHIPDPTAFNNIYAERIAAWNN